LAQASRSCCVLPCAMELGSTVQVATPAVPVRTSKLGKVSAALMLLGCALMAVGFFDGSASDSVGAFLPALTAPSAPTNAAPRSYLEAIEMSTRFTDPYVKAMKKKNAMTGSTKNLMGYTVGSRAPAVAKKSGTTIFEATGKSYYGNSRPDMAVGYSGKPTTNGKDTAVSFGLGLTLLGALGALATKLA